MVNILMVYDLMVILDNYVSKFKWCCLDIDGNGFWGDEYFDVEIWMLGFIIVVIMFSSNLFVVVMSLWNVLRGLC